MDYPSDKNDKVIEVSNDPLGVSREVDASHGGIDLLGVRPIRWVLGFDDAHPPRPNGSRILKNPMESANYDPHWWE